MDKVRYILYQIGRTGEGGEVTRYGFVPFGGDFNIRRVEHDLNEIWIGSYKLWANLSKYEHKATQGKLRVEPAKPPLSRIPLIPNYVALRRDSQSYIKAVVDTSQI